MDRIVLTGSAKQGSGDPAGGGAAYPGERLGLPAAGPGGVAGLGRRGLAFGIDLALRALVAGLFTAPRLPGNWSVLVWALLTIVSTSAFGMTPGMTLLGLRVARLDGSRFV